jgi:hypothetical protein
VGRGAQAASKLRQLRRELVDPWFEPPPQPLTGAQVRSSHRSSLIGHFVIVKVPMLTVWVLYPSVDTLPPEQLADPDSRFISIDGIQVHYKQTGGNPDAPAILLLHGFNGSVFNWCEPCCGWLNLQDSCKAAWHMSVW